MNDQGKLADVPVIKWHHTGYPTKASLSRLRAFLTDMRGDNQQQIKAFYAALQANYYPHLCGPDRVEVRGEVIDVWAYHTGGWSGNEDIIAVLRSYWLWGWLLERYDSGGHYYFRLPNESKGLIEDD